MHGRPTISTVVFLNSLCGTLSTTSFLSPWTWHHPSPFPLLTMKKWSVGKLCTLYRIAYIVNIISERTKHRGKMSEENQKRSLKKSTLLWKRVTLAQKYLKKCFVKHQTPKRFRRMISSFLLFRVILVKFFHVNFFQ